MGHNARLKKVMSRKGYVLLPDRKTEIARIHRGIKGVPGAQSSGACTWFHLMHRHSSLMEKNKVIMHRLESMRSLHTQQH